MKLPGRILSRVRGPMIAAAVIGCSSAPSAAPIEQEPVTPVEPAAVVAPAVDPVDYDPDVEAARLERADRELAAAETRRTRRIEAEEAEHARRIADRGLATQPGIGFPPGIDIGTGRDWIHAGCGRG